MLAPPTIRPAAGARIIAFVNRSSQRAPQRRCVRLTKPSTKTHLFRLSYPGLTLTGLTASYPDLAVLPCSNWLLLRPREKFLINWLVELDCLIESDKTLTKPYKNSGIAPTDPNQVSYHYYCCYY